MWGVPPCNSRCTSFGVGPLTPSSLYTSLGVGWGVGWISPLYRLSWGGARPPRACKCDVRSHRAKCHSQAT